MWPLQPRPLLVCAVLHCCAERFRFEIGIKVAGDAVGAQVRADLTEGIGDFRGVTEKRLARKIFHLSAQRKDDGQEERAGRRSSLQQAFEHLARCEIAIHRARITDGSMVRWISRRAKCRTTARFLWAG